MGMYPVGVSKEACAVNAAARLPRKLPETRLRCRPMFARIPSASLSFWGRSSLALAFLGLPLYASCTSSEDTEPFVPAVEGASQSKGEGTLIAEEDACARLLSAAKDAYKRLGCDAPDFVECPGFLRPGGGSGCYEYYEGSVATCEKTYKDAPSCRELSPCLAVAERNDALATCEQVEVPGDGGAGGAGVGPAAGATNGGAVSSAGAPMVDGGAANVAGAAGQSVGGAG